MPRIGPGVLALSLLILGAAPAWAHGLREAGLAAQLDEAPIEVAAAAPALARPADSAARLEPTLGRAPAGRSGVGPAEAAGLLIVALGLAGFGRSWRRDRWGAIAAVTAGLLLGFVVKMAPHLAHHILDADKGASCQVLQAAERSHATVGVLDAPPPPVLALLTDIPPTAFAPALAAPVPRGRAPPA